MKTEGITRKLYIPKRRTPGVCGAMSKMFVGGCWYFLEKCWKTGGKRTRCPRQPIVDMDVDCRRPRHDENYSSLFVENSHPETLHRDMCIACSGSSWILPMYLTNFQVSLSQIPQKNEFRTKKILNQEFLYEISSFCTLSENNSLLHGNISCYCIFLAKNGVFNTNSNSPQWAMLSYLSICKKGILTYAFSK